MNTASHFSPLIKYESAYTFFPKEKCLEQNHDDTKDELIYFYFFFDVKDNVLDYNKIKACKSMQKRRN